MKNSALFLLVVLLFSTSLLKANSISNNLFCPAPSNFTTTVDADKVTFSWDPVIGASSYKLTYTSLGDDVTHTYIVESTMIEIPNLSEGQYDACIQTQCPSTLNDSPVSCRRFDIIIVDITGINGRPCNCKDEELVKERGCHTPNNSNEPEIKFQYPPVNIVCRYKLEIELYNINQDTCEPPAIDTIELYFTNYPDLNSIEVYAGDSCNDGYSFYIENDRIHITTESESFLDVIFTIDRIKIDLENVNAKARLYVCHCDEKSPRIAPRKLSIDNKQRRSINKLTASPNPFTNTINIQYKQLANSKTQLFIYNIYGNIVYQYSDPMSSISINKLIEVDIPKLVAGIYYCTIQSGESIETIKLIKQ